MSVRHALNWFEVPATDLSRARRFYEAVLATELAEVPFGEDLMAMFPTSEGAVGGCLIQGHAVQAPADGGTVIYLDARPSIDAAVGRVVAAGGAVLVPVTALPPGMGHFAVIRDTEGNRVGLHMGPG